MDELFEVLLKDYEPFQKKINKVRRNLRKGFKKVKRYVVHKIKRIRPTIKNFVWQRF